MTFPYYTGKTRPANKEKTLPVHKYEIDQGDKYIPDDDLVKVVNVSLLLGQPLLVTGEPGIGKTQLAYSVGREMGYKVLRFDTKSTSSAEDLFYTYDSLGRYHDARLKITKSNADYITYNALGYAILRSREYADVEKLLPFAHKKWEAQRRSIVLIDEIDKASRDFSNDLLNELEKLFFRIPELGSGLEDIRAANEYAPVVIITSNSEKLLPEAFLRRCIYYNLPFPDKKLNEILAAHFPDARLDTAFASFVTEFFESIRGIREGVIKKPSLSEYINWLTYLQSRKIDTVPKLLQSKDEVYASLSTMLKTKNDLEIGNTFMKDRLARAASNLE